QGGSRLSGKPAAELFAGGAGTLQNRRERPHRAGGCRGGSRRIASIRHRSRARMAVRAGSALGFLHRKGEACAVHRDGGHAFRQAAATFSLTVEESPDKLSMTIYETMPKQVDLLQGTLDMLILKAVSLGPLHGYGVLLRIQQISGEQLEIQQGSLYPALYRLEHQGAIA